ncbi:hypothetical protein FA95DRAFT_1684470 [Auriscalpium vulgare]|uniref:Uncharacterized protein n=1 Tax=Auriscalpium vulgare TaxID=40419 RepID=A0ACB8R4H9_9AGAM|nr:hypothetical protein FA95DRAFT_1684470 [Auriscalpium vulgare]
MVAGVGDPVNPADDYAIYFQARAQGDVASRTFSESSSASLPSQSVWKGSAGSLDSVSTGNSTVVSVLLPSVSEKEALNTIVCLDNTAEAPVFDLPAGWSDAASSRSSSPSPSSISSVAAPQRRAKAAEVLAKTPIPASVARVGKASPAVASLARWWNRVAAGVRR